MNLKQVLTWAAIAFLVWYVVQNPGALAHFASTVARFMNTAATGLQHFTPHV